MPVFIATLLIFPDTVSLKSALTSSTHAARHQLIEPRQRKG